MRNPTGRSLAVIEALRDATRTRHAQLGSCPAMSRLFAPQYTLAEYRSHLGRLLGLLEPLEQAIADAVDAADPVRSLERSSALRRDLSAMGTDVTAIDALERCRSIPAIAPTGVYGYVYVMLGSMKGGKIIVERLRKTLGPTASFHFYGDGHERSESLWASFCSDLEENGKDNVEAICTTAVAIFAAYASWLSEPILDLANWRGNSCQI